VAYTVLAWSFIVTLAAASIGFPNAHALNSMAGYEAFTATRTLSGT
jgi:hypothetical protein